MSEGGKKSNDENNVIAVYSDIVNATVYSIYGQTNLGLQYILCNMDQSAAFDSVDRHILI